MKALKLFTNKTPLYFTEQSLHRMKVQDRKRDILLTKLDLEWEEPERQVYVEHGTHPRVSMFKKVKLLLINLLP